MGDFTTCAHYGGGLFIFFILAGLQNNRGVQHLACHIDNQNVPKLATKLNLYSPHWDRSILCKQNVFRGFTMRQKSFLIFQLFFKTGSSGYWLHKFIFNLLNIFLDLF